MSYLYVLMLANIYFSFELCSDTSLCYDTLHGQCLFQMEHAILVNCLYVTGSEVRKCQTTACHGLSFNGRARWRHEMRSIYRRAGESPCYSSLPFLPTTPSVALVLPEVSVTFSSEVTLLKQLSMPLHTNTQF